MQHPLHRGDQRQPLHHARLHSPVFLCSASCCFFYLLQACSYNIFSHLFTLSPVKDWSGPPQGQDEEVCSQWWGKGRGGTGRKVRQLVNTFLASGYPIFRSLIQGKRTVIRMLGIIISILLDGKLKLQLLLFSLFSSVGPPSTPDASCSSL